MIRYHDRGLLFRPGLDPASAPHKPPLPPLQYRRRNEQGLSIEQNISIPLRDGTTIYADIYRPLGPDGEHDLPLLLAWGPYGKHAVSNQVFWPLSGVNPDWLSNLTPFEGPDPVYWGKRRYAVAVVDPRGAWQSQGDFYHNGIQEAEDCFDTIAFLADQPWSNGKIGMTGVSYLAAIQYYVASMRPPALVAINPWEGFSDWYREFAYHGGILETGFLPRASDNIRYSLGRTEDTWENARAHPLIDEFWRSKEVDLEAIEIPAYVVASWSDQGLHLRGTIAAYERIQSEQKWLEVHGQKKWAHYYQEKSSRRRSEFFDHFMLNRNTALAAWPKVRLDIRESHGVATERAERGWPIGRTIETPLYIDGRSNRLETSPCATQSRSVYDAVDGELHFVHQFQQETEITGPMKLRLWVEAEGAEDMDIFVAVQKLDRLDQLVGFTFYTFYEDGPVALGWLRASHRALDKERTTTLRPVHLHDREELLPANTPVAVDIELWPSSTLFHAGEKLRLVIKGSDIYTDGAPNMPFARHEELRNSGRHIIHSGGKYDSHLLIPIIPKEER